MSFSTRYHFAFQLALAIFSGILNVALFPKLGYVGFAWVFLTPLLIASHKEGSTPKAFVLGWACGAVFFTGSCYWITAVLRNYGNLEWWVSGLAFLLLVIYLATFYGLFSLLFARFSTFSPVGVFYLAPFLWVSIELARAHLLTGFPWCLAGYALVDKPHIAQVSTVTGVYGLSFIIVLVNSLLVAAISFPSWRSFLKLAGVGLAIAASGWLWKIPHLSPTLHANRARIVQTNIRFDQDWGSESRSALLDELIHLSVTNRNAMEDNRDSYVKLILWPETPTPFYFNQDPDFRYQLELIAKHSNAYFLFGFVDFRNSDPSRADGLPVNSVAVLSPSGEKISQYDKVHLVPFGEYVPYPKLFFFIDKISTEAGNFVPGREIVVSKLENGHNLGTFICYEAIFPELVRQFALNGAELLVNVTNDAWFGDSAAPSQHFNMARMRAMENRRYLLRAANDGISAIVNPYGEVLLQSKRFQRTVLEGGFETNSQLTFYTRFGDVFAWACVLLSAGFFMTSSRRKNADKEGISPP